MHQLKERSKIKNGGIKMKIKLLPSQNTFQSVNHRNPFTPLFTPQVVMREFNYSRNSKESWQPTMPRHCNAQCGNGMIKILFRRSSSARNFLFCLRLTINHQFWFCVPICIMQPCGVISQLSENAKNRKICDFFCLN